MLKTFKFASILTILIVGGICSPYAHSATFRYHWEIDETPEGSESATVNEPVEVTLLDQPVQVASHSASLSLMRRYKVHLGPEWSPGRAYKLLKTFDSIGWGMGNIHGGIPSVWRLSDRHIQNDIEVEYQNGQRVVTLHQAVFRYAEPLLAEIEGVRGRYFSKRLHRAVVRFVTDNGADRYKLNRILEDRYAVSINVPDYEELTRHTTGEDAGHFSEFKNEELLALISMFEEFPQGMHKVPGLKYIVRRSDGLPHPIPSAAAVAWTGAGYIEFTEAAFRENGLEAIHRLILHEKAHFLWEYLFDEQLKQDWIELGGWFKNPRDPDGWSTTKQVEFVSAYAHGVNPNEDMAESISYYIVNPDKLRSRSPAKYEFIQNRVMHGTRYISKIREDLTFEVYNLYPDYVYPGRIIRVDIQVEGEPEEDKRITVEIELHGESDLDAAKSASTTIYNVDKRSPNNGYISMSPVEADGMRIDSGHILRGSTTLSKHAPHGYWHTDQINIRDAHGNRRFASQTDFGWKLYIDSPLAYDDDEPPEYVKDSMRLSLSEASTEEGRAYQILTARWQFVEKTGMRSVSARIVHDQSIEFYSNLRGGAYFETRSGNFQERDGLWEVSVRISVPDYVPSGTYNIVIGMTDLAKNADWIVLPDSIEIQTANLDVIPPELDLNRITIQAEPTHPEAPNGETRVDITFRVKDNISGYDRALISLRDPQGFGYPFHHLDEEYGEMYFSRDPTRYQVCHRTIILPVGSAPGTWGLGSMNVWDKAGNKLYADFTEIVRFEVDGVATAAPIIASLPDNTRLLANYPNPFNPETWIPYQLVSSSDVEITIYDTKGHLIRTLALGHQEAGYYTNRHRAAYWNGLNSLGEQVASGVYFYQLRTDAASQMRKMVILK